MSRVTIPGRHVLLAAALLCVGGTPVAAQTDVPGHAAFRTAPVVLLEEDWSRTEPGDLPVTLEVIGGSMEVVQERGRRMLRVNQSGTFDLLLPAALPAEYTIEIDMLQPWGYANAVEIRPALRGEPAGYASPGRRERNPTVFCGAQNSGIYGPREVLRRFDRSLADVYAPCQVIVSERGVRVYFAGELAANAPGVDLGRSNRLRVHVPARPGEQALIGTIRIAATQSAATVAAPPPQEALPVPSAPNPQSPPRSTPQREAQPLPQARQPSASQPSQPPPQVSPQPADTPVGVPSPAAATPAAPGGAVVSGQRDQPVAAEQAPPPGASRSAVQAAVAHRAAGLSVAQAVTALLTEFQGTPGGGPNGRAFDENDALAAMLRALYPVPDVVSYLRQTGRDVGEAVATLAYAGSLGVSDVMKAVHEGYRPALLELTKSMRTHMNARVEDLVAVMAANPQLFSPGAPEVVRALIDAGYADLAVFDALRTGRSPEQIAQQFLAAKVAANRVALALVNSFNLSAPQIAGLLRQQGVGGVLIAQVLTGTLNLTDPAAALRVMQQSGYALDDLVRALQQVFGLDLTNTVFVLRTDLGILPQPLLLALQQAQVDVQAAVNGLVTGGFPQPDVVAALRVALNKSAADVARLMYDGSFGAQFFSQALASQFGLTNEQLAQILKGSGYSAVNVAAGLKGLSAQLGADAVARLLLLTGFDATPIKDALLAQFNLTIDQVTQILANLGVK